MADSYTTDTKKAGNITSADIVSSVGSLRDVPGYDVVTDTLRAAVNTGMAAIKISLSEIGFWKQVVSFGGRVDTKTERDPINGKRLESVDNKRDNYIAWSTPYMDRLDTTKEAIIKCGDYFMPLSLSYSLSAQKSLAVSQLVDGAEIIQRTAKKSKSIDVTVRIEKNTDRIEKNTDRLGNTASAHKMAFVTSVPNAEPEYDVKPYEEEWNVPNYKLAQLASVLNDLYETKDAFKIENTTINNDFRVEWVVMERFDYNANQGSTIVDIRMTLREINMDENAIIFGEATVNPNKSAGGGER